LAASAQALHAAQYPQMKHARLDTLFALHNDTCAPGCSLLRMAAPLSPGLAAAEPLPRRPYRLFREQSVVQVLPADGTLFAATEMPGVLGAKALEGAASDRLAQALYMRTAATGAPCPLRHANDACCYAARLCLGGERRSAARCSTHCHALG
jgi:hypothetical protein